VILTAELPSKQIDEAIRRAKHLRPLLVAVRDHGCSLLVVTQHSGAFAPPPQYARRLITLLGDDLTQALGPSAFDRASVESALRAAEGVCIVACAPILEPYAGAAALAVMGANSVLIETRPEHEISWVQFVQEAQPGIRTMLATVRGGTA
jgi:hypothetical protein